MGGGGYNEQEFKKYSASVGRNVTRDGSVFFSPNTSVQDVFVSKRIQNELNPYNVLRECCDTTEHPNTIPVILALDVTGSMGSAAMEVAKKLNIIMKELYASVKDVEFMTMGIGDLAYDSAPIQASQFESDIRIAEQLDKIYFEGGGGGNGYESYTAAWYFGLKHTKLDCWNRNKKGIIITMGDEPLNPYLPGNRLKIVTGDNLESNIETSDLYELAAEKFDIYHLAVNDRQTCYGFYSKMIHDSFEKYLDKNHFKVVTLDNIANTVIQIVQNYASDVQSTENLNQNGMISW